MVSWGEIVIVFFIALLLFGADKIPEFARTAGKMMGEYRRVRDSLRSEIDNVKDEIDDVKSEVENMERGLESEIEEVADDVYKNLDD